MMDEKQQTKKWLLIASLIVFALLISLVVINLIQNAQNALKIVKDQPYIYEVSSYTIQGTSIISRLPYININTPTAKDLNKTIKQEYNSIIEKGEEQYTFDYSLNDDYLSLVLITNHTDSEGYPYPTFDTYTFSLDNGAIIPRSQLLENFNSTETMISNSFSKAMQEYYQKEVDSGYLNPSDCNYECFASRRQLSTESEESHLFVKNNQLTFYHSFMAFSEEQEEEFYRLEDFLFTVNS